MWPIIKAFGEGDAVKYFTFADGTPFGVKEDGDE